MPTPPLTLAQPLCFRAREQPSLGIVVLTAPAPHLQRHDLVQFVGGPPLLVLRVTDDRVSLGRAPVQKRRELGGSAYRRWLRLPIDEFPEAVWPAAPRRARPLVRRREAWPEVFIPGGATGFVISRAHAEGSLS